jgi:hypothetical protein
LVMEKPNAVISHNGRPEACERAPLILGTQNSEGSEYLWNKDGMPLESAGVYEYSAVAQGVYSVTVTNICGSSNSNELLIGDCIASGLDQPNANEGFIVYPNPTTGSVTLEFLSDFPSEGPAQIEIINAVGQAIHFSQVFFGDGKRTERVELDQSLADGIYILRLTLGEKVTTIKIILKR